MPKNNSTKALVEELTAVQADLSALETKVAATSPSTFKSLDNQIKQAREALEDLSDPGNDVNEEVQSGSAIGQGDATSVALFINNYFATSGIYTSGIKVPSATTSNGRVKYSFSTTFTCTGTDVMWAFVDKVALNVSYTVTSLDFTAQEDGSVKGTMGFSITYLP